MDYIIKNIYPIIKKYFLCLGSFLGTLLAIKDVTEYFFPQIYNKTFFDLALFFGIFFIIICNWPKKEFEFFIKNKDIKIKLVIGDILKQNASIIVPTNSTFDTKMENDFISIKSVQGQVQEKYFKNNLNTLNVLLDEALKDYEYIQLEDRRDSKSKQYEIGTTAEINHSDKRFYFVANSHINARGQTVNPSLTNITDSLSRLWQYINECGHVENIAIPLLGTGRMGIINSREEIIKQIIFSFVVNNNTRKIANELIICIRKDDIKKFNIDMFEMLEYLKYMCKYQYSEYNISDVHGTGIDR